MKNIFKLSLIALLFVASSCSDKEDDIVKIMPSDKPVLLSPVDGSNYVLSKAKANDLAASFIWEYATYKGTQTVVNYEVQFVTKKNDVESVFAIAQTTNTFVSLTNGQLNTAALDASLTPDVSTEVEVRVKSVVGLSGAPMYSNSFKMMITPYAAWENWGVIGSATPTGWDSDTDLIFDPATKTYSINIDLTAGNEFKFRLENAWDVNLGASGPGEPLTSGGGNILVAEGGNYTITLNVAVNAGVYSGTYTLIKN